MRCAWLGLLLLLPACWMFSSDEPDVSRYVLTWYCISPDGCEHADEAARIDRAAIRNYAYTFMSTQAPAFHEEATLLISNSLPDGCSWLYYLSFFGHDLERSMVCGNVAGFELDLSSPNADPTTHSQWVVSGRDTRFL